MAPAAFHLDSIPPELRERPQWVNWRAEERNGKMTKIPICPTTGDYASVSEPSTWTSFDEAVVSSTSR